MKNQVVNNNNNNEVGICSICGTVHVDPNGFDMNRVCRECGEKKVFSITEFMDIVNDYFQLKEDYNILSKVVKGDY